MSDLVIPDSRFEMPSLFLPGVKPVGNVRIDWGHPLASGVRYMLSPDMRGNLVSGVVASLGAAVIKPKAEGLSLVNADSSDYSLFLMNESLLFDRDQPFTVIYSAAKDSEGSIKAMVMGSSQSNSFIWEPAGKIRLYTDESKTHDFPTNHPLDKFRIVAITSTGNGGSSVLSAYINGEMFGQKIGVAAGFSFNRLMSGLSNSSYNYNGRMRDVMVFAGCKSSDEIRGLSANPYQFLIPA